MTGHPDHPVRVRTAGLPPARPVTASGWLGRRQRRTCRRTGGHWWHPEGMIGWFCCQCGHGRDGMPQDGAR